MLLLTVLSLPTTAVPFRFEVEGKITSAEDSSGIMLGTTDGASLIGKTALMQIEVDDSRAGDWIKFQLFVNGRLAVLPRYDLGSTTANVWEYGPILGYTAEAGLYDLMIYRYEDNGGYVWGYEPGIEYWESSTFRYRLDIGLMAWTERDDPWFSHPRIDGLVDLDGPDLIVDAWVEFDAHGGTCEPWQVSYGCAIVPTAGADGFLWFRGQTARRGWSDMTTTVSTGNLAPLFGLLVLAGVLVRRARR